MFAFGHYRFSKYSPGGISSILSHTIQYVYKHNRKTVQQNYTKKVKYMKKIFTSNWHIYKVCLPAMSKQTEPDGIFEKLLLEAVDEALSWLGEIAKQTFYSHLKEAAGISKKDIPYNIDEFANVLEQVFGVGAKLLEIQIMKLLHEKVGDSFEYAPNQEDLTFTEYVTAARANLACKREYVKTEESFTC